MFSIETSPLTQQFKNILVALKKTHCYTAWKHIWNSEIVYIFESITAGAWKSPPSSLRTALRCVPHSYNIWRQFAAQGVTAQSSLGGPGVKTWHRVLKDVTSQQGAQHKLERIILEFSFLRKVLWQTQFA